MLTNLYAIRDVKAQLFSPPIQARTDIDALRVFEAFKRDPKHPICLYPDDFQLYLIGQFNDASGQLVQTEVAQLVQYPLASEAA